MHAFAFLFSTQPMCTHPLPPSIHVILRNEMVDRAKPGDKVVFTGTLVAVPDVRQMSRGVSMCGVFVVRMFFTT